MDPEIWYSSTESDDDPKHSALKPIIKELIRTEVCPAVLKFLVDKIVIISYPSSNGATLGAYRLWLTDGQKSIQAILKRDIHPYIVFGDVKEGSYINVTKYQLARVKKRTGHGDIFCLFLADLQAVGFDGRRSESPVVIIDHGGPAKSTTATMQLGQILPLPSEKIRLNLSELHTGDKHDTEPAGSISDDDSVDLVPWYDARPSRRDSAIKQGSPEKGNDNSGTRKRQRDDTPTPLQPRSPNVSSQSSKSRKVSNAQPSPKKRARISTASQTSASIANSVEQHRSFSKSTEKHLLPVNRLLKLRTLSQIIGLNASRNKVIDVFAVVHSVTATLVRCPGLRPGTHYKRELRLIDPSTTKKVMLSVFVDPDNFNPAVGTIALFRSVTTNHWDGGSLNAFGRDCEGRKWFVSEPVGVERCDLMRMKEWWLKQNAEAEDLDREIKDDVPRSCGIG